MEESRAVDRVIVWGLIKKIALRFETCFLGNNQGLIMAPQLLNPGIK